MLRRWSSCGGVLFALFLVAGCASRVSVPPEVTNDLAALRSVAQRADSQIERTVAALKDLVTKPQQDLKPQYDTFSYELAALQRVEESATSQRNATDTEVAAYFDKWDERIKALESEDMRELGTERRAEGMQSFKELQGKIDLLRSAYQPFAKDLRDINSYLASDLTMDGLKGIKPVTSRAIEAESVILERLSEVVTQLDSLMKTG